MRIIINTASTYKGGGLQVAISFIEECRNYTANEYHVILGAELSKLINTKSYPDNFSFYTIGFRPATRVFSFKSHTKFFRNLESKIKPDVILTTSGPAYWRPHAPHVVGYNLPHHIYPESPYFGTLTTYRRLRWKAKRLIARYFFRRDADVIVVQTDDMKGRLMDFLGRKNIIEVSNTFSSFYCNPKVFRSKLSEKMPGEFRFLTLSAWYPHKNLTIIPETLSAIPESVRERIIFVLTLPQDVFEKEFPRIYPQNIINVGPVRSEEGPSLYQECDAMFLPTLLECFSASYAEAMIMEKPILTTDMSFAQTICGDAAMYFNPLDATDIASKIMQLISSPALQLDLIQKGKKRMTYFGTARQRAEEYLKICEDLSRK